MYTSVLVPLDGSTFGESAIPAAVAIAKRSGARLHLIHVRGATTTVGTGLPGMTTGWGPEAERGARSYLDGVVKRTSTDLGGPVSSALLDGAIGDAVCDYGRNNGISLIVMSTHGRRGLSRLWLGSVAAWIVRESPSPVLLVRPRKNGARPGATLRIRRILIPLDGSPMSERIVAPAAALGKLTGAALTLVLVIEPVFRLGEAVLAPAVEYDRDAHEQRESESREYLDRVAARLRDDGFEVETVVDAGEAVHALLETSRVSGADLIAIATHGRAGLQRLAFGSIADKIVRTSTLPVLVVRPPTDD